MQHDEEDVAGSIGPGYPWCRADRAPNVVERLRRREPIPRLGDNRDDLPQGGHGERSCRSPRRVERGTGALSFVTTQTMTQILRALARDGRLTHEPHLDHGQIIQYRFTAKDERLHALGDFEVMAIEETMLVQFPAKGRRNCPKC